MTALLTEIVELLVGGLTSFGTGIGTALSGMVSSIFIAEGTDGMTLSIFGGVIVVFSGISLAVGLSRWVVNFLTSLGSN